MGALTSNRKRGDEHLSSNHDLQSHLRSPDFRVSKKLRFSTVPQGSEPSAIVSSKNIISRLARYPESMKKLPREVHGPCRLVKFGLRRFGLGSELKPSSGLRTELNPQREEEDMGNWLSFKYNKARSEALGSLRYIKKDERVIDVDDEPENAGTSGDSIAEEVEVIEHRREGGFEVGVSEPNLYEEGKLVEPLVQASPSSVISGLRDGNLKLDTESSLAVYKSLIKTAEKRTSKLVNLDFQINLAEKRLSAVRARPLKKPEVPQDAFVTLSKEDKDKVARALLFSNRRKVLVTHENSNIEITGELLQCLSPCAWLNDEVINVYLELLKERENREPKKFLKCHFFNTFFYKKLIGGRTGYDYKSVRRWTTQRKLGYGLIECDKIFVPIHKEIHWCLAVIDKKEKKFQYLDSLGGRDSQVLKVLAKYFVDEVKEKSGMDIDVHSWEQEYVEDLPEQQNGYDCGVFMVKYADFYSRGQDLCFSQKDMPYFRLRTAKEILRLRAD